MKHSLHRTVYACGAILVAAVLSLALGACKPAESPTTPRSSIRSTLVAASVVTVELAGACQTVAEHLAGQNDYTIDVSTESLVKARDLARACATAYKAARAALMAADDAIEAWDAGSAGKAACAARPAISSIMSLRDAVSAYAKIPETVNDILDALRLLAGLASTQCTAAPGGK